MMTFEYITVDGVICEYKNCKQQADCIRVKDESEDAWEKGKLRCEKHKENYEIRTLLG